MSTPKHPSDRIEDSKVVSGESGPFDLKYEPVDDVDPLELIGNAHLALHHHMAPADGGFDLGGEDDD